MKISQRSQWGKDFQVSLESDLRKDLQADSVELMEFIINLEDEYQMEIPDKAIDEFNTVGTLSTISKKRTAVHYLKKDRSEIILNGLFFCSFHSDSAYIVRNFY